MYALHAPEVECVGEGKARHPYEFGVMVSIATTEKGNLIVDGRAFLGNSCDGNAVAEQIKQVTILMQDVKVLRSLASPSSIWGVGVWRCRCEIIQRGRIKSLDAMARRLIKRRQAVIGRLRIMAELAQRIGRRCAAPGVVCRRVQPALADAGSGPPVGLKALFALCVPVGMLGRVVSGNAARPLGGRVVEGS